MNNAKNFDILTINLSVSS